MAVDVHWRMVGQDDDAWNLTRVLYAYLCPRGRETLYIGKADGAYSSVRTRFDAADKSGFWRDLQQQRGMNSTSVLVGELGLDEGARLTRQLLADMESLLIAAVAPWGNIQCRTSRITRPGLVVRCHGGAWRGPRIIEDHG